MIIVHTMGRTASDSITEALYMKLGRDSSKFLNFFSNHLTDSFPISDKIHRFINELYRIKTRNQVHSIHFISNYTLNTISMSKKKFIRGHRVRKEIDSYRVKGKKYYVITLTREPIHQAIASFFQTIQGLEKFSDVVERYGKNREKTVEETINFFKDGVTDLINKEFKLVDGFEYNLNIAPVFFDNEIKGVHGIDVFESDFSTKKGYKIYSSKYVDMLVIRLENLNECITQAMKEFLGYDSFSIGWKRKGEDKLTGAMYKDFCKKITLPVDYVDKIYSTEYVKHFYSNDEIKSFKKKWS